MIIVSGSCINFDRERQKIVEFVKELEQICHITTDCEVSSNGSALGWDFFQIYFEPDFVEGLMDVYPEIEKQEGITIEQQFVFWLSNQFKKQKLNYYLKLYEIPYESVSGFRLDPNNYRDDSMLEDLR